MNEMWEITHKRNNCLCKLHNKPLSYLFNVSNVISFEVCKGCLEDLKMEIQLMLGGNFDD